MKLTTSNSTQVTRIKALLYGDSGTGKTTSLGTLSEDKTLIIAGERSLIPLRHRAYPVARIEEWGDIETTLTDLRNDPTVNGKAIATIAVDSLFTISEMCKDQITGVDRKALMMMRSKGKTDKPENIHVDLLGKEDWNLYQTRMRQVIAALVNLPFHVVMLCLADWREDSQTSISRRVPKLNGALAVDVAAYFDLVMHFEIQQGGGRVWRTANDNRAIAKDASAALDQLEAPDWAKVFGKILAKKGATN